MKKTRCVVCEKKFKTGYNFGGNICPNCVRKNLIGVMCESDDEGEFLNTFLGKIDTKQEPIKR